MRVFLLFILCSVASKDVVAQGENEIKRGTFPFMAFLYYPTETVLDKTGARFMRGGVLITNEWLVSSGDVAFAFPQKTLLARAGAVNLDSKLNFNEDEEEQEREIIMIMRPHNYSVTEWWSTDISLLKTLLPFNMTSSVSSRSLISNSYNTEKTCFVLVYTKAYENATERNLIQLFVEPLPSTPENCGTYFRKETMVCAADTKDDRNSLEDPNFCEGNSGGPLICDEELTGLQTYISDCKQPHLYQLLTGWKKFISCGTQGRCSTESCADTCITVNKDPPSTETNDIAIAENIDAEGPVTSNLFGSVNDVLNDTIYNQSRIYLPTQSTTTIKEVSTVNEQKIVKSTLTEMTVELDANDTVIMNTSDTHDTTVFAATEISTYAGEEVTDSTQERVRNSHIEVQHQLVHNDASKVIPSPFIYLISTTCTLAFTLLYLVLYMI